MVIEIVSFPINSMVIFHSYELPEGILNYGYNYLGKFHHDLTVLLHWNHVFFEGNHPHVWPNNSG